MEEETLIVHGVDGDEAQQNTARSLFKLEYQAILTQPDVLPDFALQLGLLNVFVYSHATNVMANS